MSRLNQMYLDYSSNRFIFSIRDFLMLVFITEIMFGGSLGFMIYGIPFRKLLFFILIGSFFLSLIVNPLLRRWQLILLFSLMFIILMWGLLIPTIRGVDLAYSIAESSPLLGLLLVYPLVQSFKKNGLNYYLDYINWIMAVVSFVIIVVWFLANLFESPEYALGLKLFFIFISGDDFGAYIGPMPDGSFRVMWITCLILPFLLIYKNFNSFRLGWSIFYLVAIYATGTRSFLYAAFIILFILLFRHRRMLFALVFPFTITVMLFGVQFVEGIRLFEIASEFDSEGPRFEQFFSLLRLFADNPIMGAGFGGQADILRSDVAPYSYELTYVALLAKLGSLGFIGFITILVFWAYLAIHRFPEKNIEIFLIIFTFLFITSTNPYLLNSVGITLVSFFIAVIFYQDGLGINNRFTSILTVKGSA
jgi:O-Antigen ligase